MNKLKSFFNKKKGQQSQQPNSGTSIPSVAIESPVNNSSAAPRSGAQTSNISGSPRPDENRVPSEDTLSSTTKVNSDRSTMETQANNNCYNNSNNHQCQSTFVEDVGSSRSSSDESYELDDDDIPEDIFPEQAELNGYTLVNKIGEGAFSKVFRGVVCNGGNKSFLTKNFSELAIKVIKKQDVPDVNATKKDSSKTSTRAQVLKEVTIHKLAASGCSEIVQFVDFQETANYYYIIQEYLSGGEIFGEIVKYTYFSEDLSRHVIRQLAFAIKHLHSVGVVHRDIKPENLLFEPIDFVPSKKIRLRKSDDPSTKRDEGLFRLGFGGGGIGQVKLADFGLSKQINQAKTKTPCGTVGYTAPEVVKDEKYSTKVDMWGIGCVLYTILCGFPPFYDEKIDTLTEKISRGDYVFLRPWWDEISDGAKNAVSRLLEVDQAKRYDIDEFLNDPWLNSYDCLKEQRAEEEKIRSHKRKSKMHLKKKMGLDSTLLYSPAAVAMRDAFDVSNAVQREEEDRREQGALGALREDEESDTEDNSEVQSDGLTQDMFQLSLDSSTIIKRRKNGVVPIATVVE
ncbi:RCK1 (YGL158W) and RCK2 (YLR248W) [Zygosaccharomyces parabailii]|uniref:non-specific serine/threonine protein kinase n=1 Tax=Zygosaccharomyces bailii (strain CLIB 213 / ATCC 58445 / CBS 680 / BCRC 21525 / NBRC 1098 / NCYC 1416 / NRRL Y-2227) TaxID=1333698 RepID=A0A8J2T7V2_ZYGB2|nr:RCK1 (YGL158W) and RCK2 (YLR248W) [Zygosaccharomyces parabailii]CDF90120.1 ZYBA0S06-01002g1_1 [Zygosaccharomyces bailii CLIB 213]